MTEGESDLAQASHDSLAAYQDVNPYLALDALISGRLEVRLFRRVEFGGRDELNGFVCFRGIEL